MTSELSIQISKLLPPLPFLWTRTLRPNCLITRSPILFIFETYNLFHFYFVQYPLVRFLRDHGYQVEVFRLPWFMRRQHFEILQAYVTGLAHKKVAFHILLDSHTFQFSELLKTLPAVQSISTYTKQDFSLSDRQNAILDQAISLAESEM